MINVRRDGVGHVESPERIGELVNHSIKIAEAVRASTDLVKAIGIEVIQSRRAVGGITKRSNEIIAEGDVWRSIVRGEVRTEIISVLMVADDIHLQREAGAGNWRGQQKCHYAK